MATRTSRTHEPPPPSNSGRRQNLLGAKDTHGRRSEPKWVYYWDNMQEIGRGGFGVVYKVTKQDMSPLAKRRTVAIKCVEKTEAGSGVSNTELTALTALARCRHKNVVAYFGKFQRMIGKVFYDCFEFEYIDGGDLFRYMWSFFQDGHSIPTTSIAYFARQMLIGLQFIHSKGYAHRDIKPENIMLTKDFVVKITDFGLALNVSKVSAQTVGLGGTPLYFPPEAFADNSQSYPGDIWAVGVTVFTMFFKGNFPFQPIDRDAIRRQAMALYPHIFQQRIYDDIYYKERDLVVNHFRDPKWPPGIDDWYGTHQDASDALRSAYDFLEKLLRVSSVRRLTAERALVEPFIKAVEPQGQQHHAELKPISPEEAAKNRKVTGLAKLQAAVKPKWKAGRKSKVSKFLDKLTKG
ncbi:hypothetical protein ACEPAF_7375 [Sanghuangporus sanghuang]|uniref:Protein kinase domain-containing protein n=1 Tax=Sanghuangporus baumii TaxID=108892 RepID=A0A9Q5HVJ6_SANBA|nr:putative protein kinase [Sanghuangporus baumii]